MAFLSFGSSFTISLTRIRYVGGGGKVLEYDEKILPEQLEVFLLSRRYRDHTVDDLVQEST